MTAITMMMGRRRRRDAPVTAYQGHRLLGQMTTATMMTVGVCKQEYIDATDDYLVTREIRRNDPPNPPNPPDPTNPKPPDNPKPPTNPRPPDNPKPNPNPPDPNPRPPSNSNDDDDGE
ncbi:uncharacterized protein ColSpa_06392 [Colletotrichum spaethianum]|uniref:Uncharacterized protein n=1 Tax=Colletotrichum spaethianum TaxID=700344 RepID=A0AA37LCP0_9PEZI|nr:uncharacterized protein ColSpa_06392 [Colletotrichum spaethianum]GKT46211.1 hypothetical protein ColSpa_06392 [Colletotrichum spaethianum]